MKRLISLFLGVLFVVISFAADKYIKAGIGYASYTGGAADTINGVATCDVVFAVENIGPYTIGLYAEGDTLTGCNGNVTIQVSGSYDESGTYTNIGSSITWTTTADYSASTMYNTYSSATTIAQHTITSVGADTIRSHAISCVGADTVRAFNMTTIDSLLYDDTLHVAAQPIYTSETQTVAAQPIYTSGTQTVAAQTITETVTMPGVDYRFIKVLFTGASSARVEIDKVGLKVNPINVPKR